MIGLLIYWLEKTWPKFAWPNLPNVLLYNDFGPAHQDLGPDRAPIFRPKNQAKFGAAHPTELPLILLGIVFFFYLMLKVE